MPYNMTKRKSRSSTPLVTTSAESSLQGTPAQSESDSDSDVQPAKKQKTSDQKKEQKSSAELCKQFGITDAEIEYTEADYKNLTNYGLFQRIVRPQVQSVNNGKIPTQKMVQVMEAKWREFREGNPLSKKKDSPRSGTSTSKVKKNAGSKQNSEDDDDDEEEDVVDKNADDDEVDEEDNDAENGKEESSDDDGEEGDNPGEVEEESEEEVLPVSRRASRGLNIKMPSIKIALKKNKKKNAKKDKLSRSRSTRKKQDTVIESDDEDDVKMVSESDDGSSDSDFDGKQRSRRPAAKKKKVIQGSDDDADDIGDLSSNDDDDANDDSSRKSKKKRKQSKKKTESEPKIKPSIPGERKSERSKKMISEQVDMSDKEFEKLLRKQAQEEDEVKKPKKRKSKKANINDLKKATKRGYWQKDKTKELDEEDDHYWFCDICQDGGDLLLCDNCPRSWHKECLKMGDVPEGEWKCPKCTGEMVSEEDDDTMGHDQSCKECREGGDVILCDTCPCVYHLHCLNPPMKEIPEGNWECPRCICRKSPLKGWVDKILTWKWTHQAKDFDEFDHTHSPQKKRTEELKAEIEDQDSNQSKDSASGEKKPKKKPERLLFVKFRDYSYWECDWITELQLEVFHAAIYSQTFKVKWDLDEPPEPEDGSSFGKKRVRTLSTGKEHEGDDLEERFYKWGVKPEYLQPQRVINHDNQSNKKKLYLVRWKDLMYEDATWESVSKVSKHIKAEFDKLVEKYEMRRAEKLKGTSKKTSPIPPKKSVLKKKLDKQPSYVDETGCKLHPYQLEGLNWMRFSWAQETNVILADEMGLGKTIQAISIIRSLWKEGYAKGPFLVAAPLSTLLNWEREFELWAPDMYCVTYTGLKDNRALIREHEFSYKEGCFVRGSNLPSKMRSGFPIKFDVLMTSYEHINGDKVTLASIPWDILVIDEAHRLKNQQSLFFKTMSDYSIKYKVLLTGTPLQNNLEELFSLLSFLEPDKFDDMDVFLDNFSEISKDEQVRKLHELLAPHMLRRMKIDVFKDLPSKSEFIVRVELSDMQKKFYKHILTKNYEALNVRGSSHCTSLMNIMMDLRKCCIHPYLFPAAEKNAPLTKSGIYEGKALVEACGKLDLLQKMLKSLNRDKHRVLIFSQMTRALDILEDFLAYMEFRYERIDGNISGRFRQEAIDRFNDPSSDSFVFLLSTKAGGLGINLATADTVIIYDMDWNPHNDIQAFSRAHRIGQKNKVMIYRFVSKNTVEEKITQVAKKKMMLTELVIERGMSSSASAVSSSTSKPESVTKQEINDILKFGAENLFKDSEEGKVVYDEEAVEKLLDRNQETVQETEKNFGLNEYLRTFRVASYHVKEDEEKDKEEEKEKEKEDKEEEVEEDNEDPEYWKRVLGESYNDFRVQMMAEQEALEASLGKGKRTRRKVNYAEEFNRGEPRVDRERSADKDKKGKVSNGVVRETQVQFMSDYEPDSDEDTESEPSDTDQPAEDDAPFELSLHHKKQMKQPKGRPKAPAVPGEIGSNEMPPLLATVDGHVEVLGFTARHRRSYLNAVMRYGLPHEDAYKSQWLVRDLRKKNEKTFKAYTSLFLRHLCEPLAETVEFYSDGVPREGLSRQHVLTRIGMMLLIRKKVTQFEKSNGTDSLLEFNLRPAIMTDADRLAESKKGYDPSKSIPAKPRTLEPIPASGKDGQATDIGPSSSTSPEKMDTNNKDDAPVNGSETKEPSTPKGHEKESSTNNDSETKEPSTPKGHEKESSTNNDSEMKEPSTPKGHEKESSTNDDSEMKEPSTPKGHEKESSTNDDSERKEPSTPKGPEESSTNNDSETKEPSTPKGPEESSTTGDTEKGTSTIEVSENQRMKKENAVVRERIQNESEVTKAEIKTEISQGNTTEIEQEDKGRELSAVKEEKMDVEEMVIEKGSDQSANKEVPVGITPTKSPKNENITEEEAMDVDKNEELKPNSDEGKKQDSDEDKKQVLDEGKNQDSKEEKRQNSDEGKKQDSDEVQKQDSDEGKKQDSDEAKKQDSNEEKKQDSDEGKKQDLNEENKEDSEKVKKQSGEGVKEELEQGKNSNKDEKTKDQKDKEKGKPSKEDARAKPLSAAKQRQEAMRKLREKFYIADGGFTELQNLWTLEEGMLQMGKEQELWHRRHDFWLLAGIVTHGYRHWQDILHDPRFEIINQAFLKDVDRMRKGAFLNRRFQILEQALVIEEQLKKTLVEHPKILDILPPATNDEADDIHTDVDRLAKHLRFLIKNGQIPFGTDPVFINLLVQIENTIGDIQMMSYNAMPCTLARQPTIRPIQTQQQPQQHRYIQSQARYAPVYKRPQQGQPQSRPVEASTSKTAPKVITID